jgi:hypothetical protein
VWLADKTLQAVTKIIIIAMRTTQGSKVAAQKIASNVHVFISLVRAFNVFIGLEKDDCLALNETSLCGVTTFDICCFRGVTALTITTPEKTLGFCQKHIQELTSLQCSRYR